MKKIIIMVLSFVLTLTGIMLFKNHDFDLILACNEIVSQESKQYYEYIENEDGSLMTNELSRQDYDISVAVEKMKREENSPYKVLREGEKRYEPTPPPFIILPNIILSGVNYGGSTTGSVTVTYQYATSAYYKIGNNSYQTFSSGTVFSDVGYYTIFCSNNDGNGYAYFTISAITESESVNYGTLPYSYETVTTTMTTARSWNYVKVVTKCDWDILVGDAMRHTNCIYQTYLDKDFRVSNVHSHTFYSHYEYVDTYYNVNNPLEFTTESGSTSYSMNLVFGTNAYFGYYATIQKEGEDDQFIQALSINEPMPLDFDLQDEVSHHKREYTAAEFVLTGYYILYNANETIGTYKGFIKDNEGNSILYVTCGNLFGWSSVGLTNSICIALGAIGLITGAIPVLIAAMVSGTAYIVGVFLSGINLDQRETFTGNSLSLPSMMHKIETAVYCLI